MSNVYVLTDGTSRGAKLLAARPFQPGEIVYDFANALVTPLQTYQTIQIDPSNHVIADDLLAKLNHSCDPNLIVDTTHRLVIAKYAIQIHDHLTFFYPSTEWEMAEPFVCQCGAANCLGWISGAKNLAAEMLTGYFLNQHIVELMTYTGVRRDPLPFNLYDAQASLPPVS